MADQADHGLVNGVGTMNTLVELPRSSPLSAVIPNVELSSQSWEESSNSEACYQLDQRLTLIMR